MFRDEEATLEAGGKAAAGRLKMGVPNSNHLSIYRWCQQLVDTPSDSQGCNSIYTIFLSQNLSKELMLEVLRHVYTLLKLKLSQITSQNNLQPKL